MSELNRIAAPRHREALGIAVARVEETLWEASGYPMSHGWSFRIGDVREILAAFGASCRAHGSEALEGLRRVERIDRRR